MSKSKTESGFVVFAILFFMLIAFLIWLYRLISNNPLEAILIMLSILIVLWGVLLALNALFNIDKKKNNTAYNKQYGKINTNYQQSAVIRPKPQAKNRWDNKLLSDLEWKRFELLCSLYFTEKGYEAKLTRQGADGGVDIDLYKNGTPFAVVQCKAWNTYKVGVKAIRELSGVMHGRSGTIPKGIFITSGEFTSEARNSSEKLKIQLISGGELLAKIKALPKDSQDNILSIVTKGDYKTPSCPSCDIKMVSRVSRINKNSFYGCKNYPRCRQTFRPLKKTSK